MNRSFTLRIFSILFLVTILFSKPVLGASLMGSEIHYVKVDTLTYDVYFIVYRILKSAGLQFGIPKLLI